ncbi:hypothetical protein BDW22DRAFT_1341122 [Trametopsis cervina]|nr:hypothetical protein BDW22DRAFT_1341122 [Trametopsis cervina]
MTVGRPLTPPAEYPLVHGSSNAITALKALENDIAGYTPTDMRHVSQTICKEHLAQSCRAGVACRHRHDLFDTKRVEVLAESWLSNAASDGTSVDVQIAYIVPTRFRGHHKWRVTLTAWTGDDRTTRVITGDTVNAALFTLESSQFIISNPGARPSPAPSAFTSQNANTSGVHPHGASLLHEDIPPSYDSATASEPPSYDSVLDFVGVPTPHRESQNSAPTDQRDRVRPPLFGSVSSSAMSRSMPPLRAPASPSPSAAARNGYLSPERRPLLQGPSNVNITYNSIRGPAYVRISPSSELPRPVTSSFDRYGEERSTPFMVHLMGLVLFSCISWVIISVILIPCTDTTC